LADDQLPQRIVNPAKTEIQLLGTPQRIKAIVITFLSLAGVEVNIAEGSVRNLGVLFDPQL
jgi:hypothetical protein